MNSETVSFPRRRGLSRTNERVAWVFTVLAALSPSVSRSADGAAFPAGPLMRNVAEFGLHSTNAPGTNREALQRAIDWAAVRGAGLWVEPSEEPYRVESGLVLRQNVSLIGVHGPVGRGTRHPTLRQPVGSVFRIEDDRAPFLTVEGSTQVRGLQFWYPEQTLNDPAKVVAYPPTIQVSKSRSAQGVTLSSLTFYGEYVAMDFRAAREHPCEQILFEHCYGYPLSGEFIRIDYCYDIPRVLHCHVNPANLRYFRGGYSRSVIDSVVARKTFTYWIDHTDNAVLMDLFTFGSYGGVYLGPATYGQLTNFNLDCVTIGIHKLGDGTFNRNWQIAQGSIIANTGPTVSEVHPIVIEGQGHITLNGVEAFSGGNPALTTLRMSQDFLCVRGDKRLTVSMVGCRMRNYAAEDPITLANPKARIQAVACVDRNEAWVNGTWGDE
ncbi:MAG: hypothetical protein AB7O66_07840 [Limisphaerales bacterium]